MYIEKAPAKINLALDVLGKRNDGFHNLRMVMTTIDLYDRLLINIINEDKIILNSNKYFLPNDERNLVYQVSAYMRDAFKIKPGLEIFIEKNIPIAAGLAGGSSDAAAMIRAINKLFKLNLTLDEMIDIGKQFGSDIPFCLYNKTALVEGRGEIITPLSKPPKCWIVLVKPNFGVSTKDVFANVNIDKIKHPDVDKMIMAIKHNNYQQMCSSLGNSLEDITFSMFPGIKEIKEKLIQLGVDNSLMSGTGPSIFGLVLKERKAKKIINSIDKTKYETFAARILG